MLEEDINELVINIMKTYSLNMLRTLIRIYGEKIINFYNSYIELFD